MPRTKVISDVPQDKTPGTSRRSVKIGDMVNTARGTFDVAMQPGTAELDGAISRFEFSKTFHGDLQGTGLGVMLSGIGTSWN